LDSGRARRARETATGGSWRTTTVAGSVALKAGVQALRVSIAGAANALDLDSIVVSGG